MRIVILSRHVRSEDVNIWSGTFWHICRALERYHELIYVGGGVVDEVISFRRVSLKRESITHFNYLKLMGDILSERIDRIDCDLVFFGDNNYAPYLRCRVPIVRLSDITYEQFKDYLGVKDGKKLQNSLMAERLSLESYTHIIYPTEWIKQKTIEYYGIDESKIDVVEFGANIPHPAHYNSEIDMSVCNLLFIGSVWDKKGGPKVLEAYNKLKSYGFAATLTIIGSQPKDKQLVEDDGLKIIPRLDKSNPLELERLCQIISESHFLVLPTEYDAFGIVFCEASAYGVPSIASDVCGVSQVVRSGENGFLLPLNATSDDYANKIKSVFEDKIGYLKLRKSSRNEYETRLNWNVWGEKVNAIFKRIVNKYR